MSAIEILHQLTLHARSTVANIRERITEKATLIWHNEGEGRYF